MKVDNAIIKVKKHGAKTFWDAVDDLEIMVHETDLGESICGFFYKRGSGRTIAVNSRLSEGKKEFVLAHELGHMIMHSHIKHIHCTKYSIFSNDKMEFEANEFAVKFLWRTNSYYSIEEFCNIHELEPKIIKDMFGGKMDIDSVL